MKAFGKVAEVMAEIYQNKKGGEENYATTISKALDITYSHTVKILRYLENEELIVYKDVPGRTKPISVPEEHEELFECVNKAVKEYDYVVGL